MYLVEIYSDVCRKFAMSCNHKVAPFSENWHLKADVNDGQMSDFLGVILLN